MTNRILIAGATSLLLAAGCATAPKHVPELARARHAVEQLANDPLASQSASRELQMARDNLARADQAMEAKESKGEIAHLSYVAERNAQIGIARLAELRAREQIAQGEAERNAVLLEAREREARLASSQAEAARQAALLAERHAQYSRQQLEQSRRELAALQAEQTERGMVLTMGDVLFDTDEAHLKPGAAPTLDRLAKFLRDHDDTRVLIEGYADSRGTDAYNEDLSRRRAAAVAEALERRGTPADRVRVVGRGEALPVASNDSAAGRQRNRRVEVVFSDLSGEFANDVTQR